MLKSYRLKKSFVFALLACIIPPQSISAIQMEALNQVQSTAADPPATTTATTTATSSDTTTATSATTTDTTATTSDTDSGESQIGVLSEPTTNGAWKGHPASIPLTKGTDGAIKGGLFHSKVAMVGNYWQAKLANCDVIESVTILNRHSSSDGGVSLAGTKVEVHDPDSKPKWKTCGLVPTPTKDDTPYTVACDNSQLKMHQPSHIKLTTTRPVFLMFEGVRVTCKKSTQTAVLENAISNGAWQGHEANKVLQEPPVLFHSQTKMVKNYWQVEVQKGSCHVLDHVKIRNRKTAADGGVSLAGTKVLVHSPTQKPKWQECGLIPTPTKAGETYTVKCKGLGGEDVSHIKLETTKAVHLQFEGIAVECQK